MEASNVEVIAIADHRESCNDLLIPAKVECGVLFAVVQDFDIIAMGKFGVFFLCEVLVIKVDLIASDHTYHT